jgi:hypothetical protein
MRLMSNNSNWPFPLCVLAFFLACGVMHAQPAQREARLQDLTYAREHYVLASRAFSSGTREHGLNLIHELEQRAGELSEAEFLVGMERLSALAQNAHDWVGFSDGGVRREKRLPLRIIWFPDAMVIARAGPPALDLVGARITAIEGLTPDQLLTRLGDLCGGPENYQRWNLTWAIESEGILSAIGIARSPDRIHFSLALPDGRQVERVISMVPSAEVPALSAARLWSGELTPEETARGWRTAIRARDEPLYLKEADEPFRLTALENTIAGTSSSAQIMTWVVVPSGRSRKRPVLNWRTGIPAI